jgi:signal transduction histidine kinase
MPLDKLKAILQDLEAELTSLTNVDDEVREHLEEAIAEIQSAIQREDPSQLEPHTLSARLTAAAERFESSHPTLFGIVGRIVNVLGQMGI